jgi:hypothetical protein
MIRRIAVSFMPVVLASFLLSCGYDKLTTITVTPQTATFTSVGEKIQFKALGTYYRQSESRHTPSTKDITNTVNWTSSNGSVATIDSSGIATSVGFGTTSITASQSGVSGGATISSTADLTQVTIIPGSQTINVLGEPAQFIAIGTYSDSPTTRDITNQVKWVSSDVSVATINSAGLALAVGAGSGGTTITALGTANNGTAITGTASLSSCIGCGPLTLPQLALYKVGTGTGTVLSTPLGIDCPSISTSGAGCTGNFVLGTPVTLTATADPGSTFIGWSANCIPPQPTSPSGGSCTITMNNNEPVGAIFTLP